MGTVNFCQIFYWTLINKVITEATYSTFPCVCVFKAACFRKPEMQIFSVVGRRVVVRILRHYTAGETSVLRKAIMLKQAKYMGYLLC
jgi:hypothetical protein